MDCLDGGGFDVMAFCGGCVMVCSRDQIGGKFDGRGGYHIKHEKFKVGTASLTLFCICK